MTEEENKQPDFEQALMQLENIVREMEAGKIKLDDAVKAYEKAIKLKKICEEKLYDAKMKIEKIEIKENNSLSLGALDKENA